MTNALDTISIKLSKFNPRVAKSMYDLTCQPKAYFYLGEIPRVKPKEKRELTNDCVNKPRQMNEYSVRVIVE